MSLHSLKDIALLAEESVQDNDPGLFNALCVVYERHGNAQDIFASAVYNIGRAGNIGFVDYMMQHNEEYFKDSLYTIALADMANNTSDHRLIYHIVNRYNYDPATHLIKSLCISYVYGDDMNSVKRELEIFGINAYTLYYAVKPCVSMETVDLITAFVEFCDKA